HGRGVRRRGVPPGPPLEIPATGHPGARRAPSAFVSVHQGLAGRPEGEPAVTRRSLWLTFGLVCVGLALAGVVLPLLPATPFLLLAAFAFTRSSPRLHAWLLGHRHFGPLIEDWRR